MVETRVKVKAPKYENGSTANPHFHFLVICETHCVAQTSHPSVFLLSVFLRCCCVVEWASFFNGKFPYTKLPSHAEYIYLDRRRRDMQNPNTRTIFQINNVVARVTTQAI